MSVLAISDNANGLVVVAQARVHLMLQTNNLRIAVSPECSSAYYNGLVAFAGITYIAIIAISYLDVKGIVIQCTKCRNDSQCSTNTFVHLKADLRVEQRTISSLPDDMKGRFQRVADRSSPGAASLVFRECVCCLQHHVIPCLVSGCHGDSCRVSCDGTRIQ